MKYNDSFLVKRDIRDGLVLDYNLGMRIGSVPDLSENNYLGEIIGAIREKDNVLGSKNILSFDGIDDHITTPNVLNFSGVGEKTIVMLFCPVTGVTSGQLFSTGSNASGQLFMLGYNFIEERISFTTYGTDYHSADNSSPLDQWSHVVVTLSLTHYSVYINGKFVATGVLNHTVNITDSSATVAKRHNSTEYVKCKVATLRLYNKQLSADDVSALYHKMHFDFGVLKGFNS